MTWNRSSIPQPGSVPVRLLSGTVMSKPFGEPLTRCECGMTDSPHYKAGGYGSAVWPVPDAKRFTDAELAAEVQSASAEVYRAKAFHDDTIPALQRFMTFRRFATTPGHGEVPDGLG